MFTRYYDEISNPMDFETMSQNLNQGTYIYMEDFGQDIELIFSNCRKFNPPQTYPVTCAEAVEKAFKKEWGKATEKRLSWSDKRGLQGLMTTLVKEDMFVK
jgi:transcription initiation factor TFIID subunit 2